MTVVLSNLTASFSPVEPSLPPELRANEELSSLYEEYGISFCDANGDTLLTIAADLGDEAWVRFLLKEGVDVLKPNAQGNTALHFAAQSNNENNTKALAQAFHSLGISVDLVNSEGYTPLHISASNHCLSSFDVLITHGANVNFENEKKHETSLTLAVDKNDVDIVRKLISLGASCNFTNETGNTALHTAARLGFGETAALLLEAGAVVCKNLEGKSPVHVAAIAGREAILDLFGEKGISLDEPDSSGLTAIGLAVLNRYEGCVEILLSRGVSLTLSRSDGVSLLYIAAFVKSTSLVERLAPLCTDQINEAHANGFKPLHLAITNKDVRMARALIANGALMHTVDSSDIFSPFFYAVKSGSVEMVTLMKELNPSIVSSKARNGDTPYIIAYLNGQRELLPLLSEDSYSKHYILLKELGLISGLSGILSHSEGEIDLEGGTTFPFYTLSAESIPDEFSEVKAEFASASVSTRDPEEIVASITAKKLTVLPAGWKDHSVSIVIQDNFMIICNRGMRGGISTFKTYSIDSSKITVDIINAIKKTFYSSEPEAGMAYIYEELPRLLSPTGEIVDASSHSLCAAIETIAPKAQAVGNCCAASVKTAVRAAFVLTMLKRKADSFGSEDLFHAKKISKEVTTSMRIAAEMRCSTLCLASTEYSSFASLAMLQSSSKRIIKLLS